jgi:hypothetical protein
MKKKYQTLHHSKRFIFTFIRDEKFIKILVDDDNIIIIIEIKNLKNYSLLYQLYILSLLCKNDDESKICCINRNFIYNNYDYVYRNYDFIKLHKDLLILAFAYNSSKYSTKETSNEEIIKSERRIKFYFNDNINTNPLRVINDFIIKLQIWDTCGQETYKNIVCNFYRNSSLTILVYAINDKTSFEDLEFWLKELKKKSMELLFQQHRATCQQLAC